MPHTVEFERNGVKIHVEHSLRAFLGEYEFVHFGPAVISERYAKVQTTLEMVRKDFRDILDVDADFQEKAAELGKGI